MMTPLNGLTRGAVLFSFFVLFAFGQGLNPTTPAKDYIRLGGQVIAIENAVPANTPNILLSPANLAFDTQFIAAMGTESLTIANTGSAPLKVTSVSLGGTNAADFSVSANTCSTVATGATCTISVSFKPSAAGNRTATLTIADNAPGASQTIPLSGTGTATAAPSSITAYLGAYSGPPVFYSYVGQTFASNQVILAGPTAVMPVRAYVPGGASLLTGLTAQINDTNDSVALYRFTLQYSNGTANLQLTNESTGANALAAAMPLTISGDTITLPTPVSTGSLQLTAYRVALVGNEFQLESAKKAALALNDMPDKGSCNMDCCLISPDGQAARNRYRKALESAGVSFHESVYFGKKQFFCDFSNGCAQRRNKQNEAAADALKAEGWPTSMYYRLD